MTEDWWKVIYKKYTFYILIYAYLVLQNDKYYNISQDIIIFC